LGEPGCSSLGNRSLQGELVRLPQPLVHPPQALGHHFHHLPAEAGTLPYQQVEAPAVDRDQPAVGAGRRGGAPFRIVDQGHFPEERPGHRELHQAAADRQVGHSIHQEVHDRAALPFMEDRLPGRNADDAARVLEVLDQVHSAPRRIEVGRQQRIFISMVCARKTLCLALILAITALPMHSLQAESVPPRTQQRTDLTLQLQQLGVAPGEASKRVEAMTDEEVASLAQSIAEAPAGEGGLACFACFAKLLILAVPVAAIGYIIFNLLSGKKPEQAEQPKTPAAPEAPK